MDFVQRYTVANNRRPKTGASYMTTLRTMPVAMCSEAPPPKFAWKDVLGPRWALYCPVKGLKIGFVVVDTSTAVVSMTRQHMMHNPQAARFLMLCAADAALSNGISPMFLVTGGHATFRKMTLFRSRPCK